MAYPYINQIKGYLQDGEIIWEYSDYSSTADMYTYLESKHQIGHSGAEILYASVQGRPGTAFSIADYNSSGDIIFESTIKLGYTGVYELCLGENNPIRQLTFTNLETILDDINDVEIDDYDDIDNLNYVLVDIIFTETS